MALEEQLEIVQEARLENLANLMTFIEDAGRQSCTDPSIRFDLKLAVEEACVNIIQYGYRDMEPGVIRLTFQADKTQVVITVRDHAPPFPPELAPKPNLDADWQERQIGGLGWHFIRQVMDEISYRPDPENGNLLTLVKHLTFREDISGKEQ